MKIKVSAYRAWCHFMAKIRRNYVQNEKILCPEDLPWAEDIFVKEGLTNAKRHPYNKISLKGRGGKMKK